MYRLIMGNGKSVSYDTKEDAMDAVSKVPPDIGFMLVDVTTNDIICAVGQL